jgi:hypothetical protein
VCLGTTRDEADDWKQKIGQFELKQSAAAMPCFQDPDPERETMEP